MQLNIFVGNDYIVSECFGMMTVRLHDKKNKQHIFKKYEVHTCMLAP